MEYDFEYEEQIMSGELIPYNGKLFTREEYFSLGIEK